MNSMPALDSGYQPDQVPDFKQQDKPYSLEKQFASIIKYEYDKATGNDFYKTYADSEYSMKTDEGSKSDQFECKECSEDFDEAARAIRTDQEDEDNEKPENDTDSQKRLEAELLPEMITNFKNEIEVSPDGKAINIEADKAEIKLNAETGLTVEESPDMPAALPEFKAESGDAELDNLQLKKPLPVEAEAVNEALANIKKNTSEESAEVANDALANIKKNTSEKAVDADLMMHHENAEGLAGKLMSENSGQFKQGNKQGNDSFNFAQAPQNSSTDTDTENLNPVHGPGALHEGARSNGNLNPLQTGKASGFQELMDKIVYVAKGNNKLGVSIEHEGIGKLNMSLTLEKGMVNVHINAADSDVRELIESNMQQILDALNKDGVSVGEFSVGLRKGDRENMASVSAGPAEEIVNEEKNECLSKGLVNIFA